MDSVGDWKVVKRLKVASEQQLDVGVDQFKKPNVMCDK